MLQRRRMLSDQTSHFADETRTCTSDTHAHTRACVPHAHVNILVCMSTRTYTRSHKCINRTHSFYTHDRTHLCPPARPPQAKRKARVRRYTSACVSVWVCVCACVAPTRPWLGCLPSRVHASVTQRSYTHTHTHTDIRRCFSCLKLSSSFTLVFFT